MIREMLLIKNAICSGQKSVKIFGNNLENVARLPKKIRGAPQDGIVRKFRDAFVIAEDDLRY